MGQLPLGVVALERDRSEEALSAHRGVQVIVVLSSRLSVQLNAGCEPCHFNLKLYIDLNVAESPLEFFDLAICLVDAASEIVSVEFSAAQRALVIGPLHISDASSDLPLATRTREFKIVRVKERAHHRPRSFRRTLFNEST